MVDLLATLLLALATTNSPSAAAPAPVPAPGAAAGAPDFATGVALPGSGEEVAYRALLDLDDRAQEQIDGWIREADRAGSAADEERLHKLIDEKISEVSGAYLEFLGKHPEHANARVAFGSFLNDTGQEFPAREQWEKALQLDPRDPAIYNNLAGSYGHRGPITNAFSHYEKAIELAPQEPLYYQNFATTVFLFRKDVMEYYALTNEQAVFDKALALYRRAQDLAPGSFLIATDLAQTFYGIRPPRHADALAAWEKALTLASDELEREGVRVHLARVQIQAGNFDAARAQLGQITNVNYAVVKTRLEKTLAAKENPAGPAASQTAEEPRPATSAAPPAPRPPRAPE